MSLQRLQARWSVLSQPVYETLSCKVCKQTHPIEKYNIHKANDIFHAGELVRYECPTCDTIFGDMRFLSLPREEISNDYIDLYSFYSEADTTPYILECFSKLGLSSEGVSYLDYGCGKWNQHIHILKQRGYDIVGWDRYVNDYEKPPAGKQFDVVFCNNYIEHVIEPYEDIHDMLQYVKPGGKLILITSCFEYVYEFTHYHTFFFLGRSIEYLEKELNMKLIDTKKIMFPREFTIAKTFEKIF